MGCSPKLFVGYDYQTTEEVFRCLDLAPKHLISKSRVVYLKDASIVERLNKLAKDTGFQEASRIVQGIEKGYEPDKVPVENDYRLAKQTLKTSRFTSLNLKLLNNYTDTTRIALAETIHISPKKKLKLLLENDFEWNVYTT